MSFDNERAMTGFWTTLGEMIADGWDAEEAVEHLLDTPEYRKNVVRSVATAAMSRTRNVVRRTEDAAAVQLRNGDIVSARQTLVSAQFALPDGRFVEWLKATPSDHRQRALWFRNRAASLNNAANIHQMAAQIIEDAGVKNLSQVNPKNIKKVPHLAEAIAGELDA